MLVQVEVDPGADQAGREAPEGDVVDEFAGAALPLPAVGHDRDGGDHRDDVREPVGVHEQRTDLDPAARRARNSRKHVHASIAERSRRPETPVAVGVELDRSRPVWPPANVPDVSAPPRNALKRISAVTTA